MTGDEVREAYSPPPPAETRPSGEADDPSAGRSAWRQVWLTGVLTTIYTLNFVDRGALNLIVQPIKDDLHVTDVQMSYLLGLSFVVLYSVCSIPAGYVADIVSRRLMVGAAVLFWSVMQTLCGFAGGYWRLFAGRVGLGVGEAALPPAAYSLLRDGIAPKNRARAFSIYQMGPLLGAGVGALVGGWIYGAASAGAFHGWPVIGQMRPWQVVILAPGLFGFVVAAMMLTVREPRRDAPVERSNLPGFGETFAYVGRHWRLYAPILIVTTVMALATGWNAWLATALVRTWGLSPAVVGKVTGPMGLILNPIAYVAIGQLMDRFTTRERPDGMLRVAIVGTVLNVPASLAVLLAPSIGLMWIALGLSILITGAGQVAIAAIMAEVTPGRLMGKATSLQFLVGNILGLAMGPTLFAAVAERFFTGPRAIADSMMVCYPAIVAVVVVFMAITARELRRFKGVG